MAVYCFTLFTFAFNLKNVILCGIKLDVVLLPFLTSLFIAHLHSTKTSLVTFAPPRALTSTQLNSTSLNGRRCEHFNVRI